MNYINLKHLFNTKKHLNFFLVLSFITINTIAQHKTDYSEIKGKVIDSNSKLSLVFADLLIEGTNIATITNTEGEFLLKFPNNIKDKYLKVQYLGYKEKLIPLSKLSNNTVIKLDLVFIKLDEVSITRPKNAETLIRTVLKKKGENYFSNNTLMTAFYRETIKKRRKNASLSEAVLEIYKQPYTTNKKDIITLIKARKSTNYTRLDTLALKLQGGPFSNLYADIIKYPQFIFTENELSQYNFTFDKSTQINNQLVYVINFKQKPEFKIPLYYGKLYIDSETYALTSAIYSLNVENRVLASELFVRKKPKNVKVYPIEANYRVNYRVSKGKWYYGYSNILLTFKVNWKGKLFNSVYTLHSEMAITDWKSTSTKFKKPKNRKLILKPTTILNDQASGFTDPEFWGEYNIIEPEKSIESAIKKISNQLKKV